MQQNDNDNNINDSANQTVGSNLEKVTKIEDWRNEHGRPDFEFLQSLVNDGSIEALEKLHSIAEDLDVDCDSRTSPKDIVDRISSAVARNDNDGFQPTT